VRQERAIPDLACCGRTPVLAYTVTERMCLGLARRDRDETEHGRETGRIVMDPDGGYREIREPVPAPRRPVAAAGPHWDLERSSRGS
jgi:hypothetical protein